MCLTEAGWEFLIENSNNFKIKNKEMLYPVKNEYNSYYISDRVAECVLKYSPKDIERFKSIFYEFKKGLTQKS